MGWLEGTGAGRRPPTPTDQGRCRRRRWRLPDGMPVTHDSGQNTGRRVHRVRVPARTQPRVRLLLVLQRLPGLHEAAAAQAAATAVARLPHLAMRQSKRIFLHGLRLVSLHGKPDRGRSEKRVIGAQTGYEGS